MHFTKKWLVVLLFSVLPLAGGCSELPHEAAYDPDTPLDMQKKGAVDGRVLLAGESDFGQVAVNASGAGYSVDAQTRANGSFSIEPLPPGSVTLTYTFRGFQTQSQVVSVDIGERVNAGSLTLEPKTVPVSGSALAQVASETTEGGVNVAFTRTGGVREASSAPALRPAAEEVTAENVQSTFSVTSDGDGNYTLTLPAGVYAVIGVKGENTSETATLEVSGESSVTVEPIVVLPVTGTLRIAGTYASGISDYSATSYAYTNTRAVTLELDGFNAAQMQIGENQGAGCAYGEKLVYSALKAFELSAGDGEKTVCVRYIGVDGIATGDITASIHYDGTPPGDPFVDTQSGNVYLASSSFALVLSAEEAGSGLQWLELSEDAGFLNAFKVSNRSVYRYELTDLSEGERSLHVRFWDFAGNFTEAVLAVTRDTTPPTGGMVVAAGKDRVASQFVTIAAAASPDTEKITLSNDPGFAVASAYAFSGELVWALASVEEMQTVYAKFTDRAGNVSAVYADAVTYDATAPAVTDFSLDVTVSSSSLGLSWQPSLAPGVLGYRWYRVRSGAVTSVTLGGFTATTSVTVMNPLVDETYAVAAEYAGGLMSALSAPATPEAIGERGKFLLVVDDDGGSSETEFTLLPLLAAAGYAGADTVTTVTVAAGSDGPSAATLSQYAVVIWNLGQGSAAPLLSVDDQTALTSYLASGGNLFVLAPNALADDDTADFLRQWGHTGITKENLAPVTSIFGVDGDAIAGGMSFEVGPAMTGVDGIEASGLSASWLKSGTSIATRYPASGPAAYRLAWAAIPATGLRERNVADLNTARLDLYFSAPTVPALMSPDADDKSVKLPLGFEIRYGTIVTDYVWVGSNGLVSFGAPVSTAVPFDPLPGPSPSTAVAAVSWSDWHPENGGAVYYTASTNEVEISWQNVPNATDDGVLTAGIKIRRDSTIELITYEAGIGPGAFAFTSFQDGTGRSYEQMGFDVDVGYSAVCVVSPCDIVPFPIAFRVFKDQVTETTEIVRNLVSWIAGPSAVVRTQERYYTINSTVDDAYEMRVSLDGALDTEGWGAYDSGYGVTFSTEGDQVVKVVYRDEAGNESDVHTDTGAVDLVAPIVTNVVLTDANNGSNASTRTRTVTLQLSGTATTQDFMRISENPAYAGSGWIPYVQNSTFTLSAGDGMKFVYVWTKDTNGNFSGPAIGSILADTEAPQTRAVVDRIANTTPVYVNSSYTEQDASVSWASLPGILDCNDQAFVDCGKFNLNESVPVAALDVPFGFNFYGRSQSRLVVFKNGFATFDMSRGEEDATRDDADRSALFLQEKTLAPLMQPLSFVKPSQGVYYFVESTQVTVKWIGVDSRSLAPIETAVRFNESGEITFVYGTGNFDVEPVIGISKGDQQNRHLSRYNLARFLPNAAAVSFVPSEGDVASIQLYYRYHFPTGPGPWTYVGNPVNDLFEAIPFYPPEGPGMYDFYTEGTDSAGNIESQPWKPDSQVFFDNVAPGSPRRIEAIADGDSVYVRWEPGASADVVAYNVYYGEDGNLRGDDAIEGRSPFEVPAETNARLTGLEAGARVYVSVTAIDSVGNESPLPGGASVIPLRTIRRLATIDGNAMGNAVLRGDDLFMLETSGFMNTFVWYDMSNPASPTRMASTAQNFDPSFLLWDGFVYSSSASYSVEAYPTWDKETGSYGGRYSVPFTGPNLLVFREGPIELVSKNMRSGVEQTIGSGQIGGKVHRLVSTPSAALAVTLPSSCSGGCSTYVHAVTASASGTGYLAGTQSLPYDINGLAVQGRYAVFAADYVDSAQRGFLEIFDLSTPSSPELLLSADANPLVVEWVGDQLAFADYFGLKLWDAGDVTAPVGAGGISLSGFATSLAFDGTIGVATLNTGFEVFELGELLPSNIEHINQPLSGQISAMVTKGDYAFVSEETGISIFDVSAMEANGPVLLSRFTPFVAVALETVSHYLVALDENHRLNVFDVSNPAQPQRIWVEEEPPVAYNNDSTSLVVFGTAVYLDDRAYDITDPRTPLLIGTYQDDNIKILRAGGGLVYGAVDAGTIGGHPAVRLRVYDVSQGSEIVEIGEYPTPVTNLVDFIVDGRSLYVYQGAPVKKLTVLDVTDPVMPALRASYPIGELVAPPGNRYLAASRGFLYLAMSEFGVTEMVQIDMRNEPSIAFAFRAGLAEYIAAPFAVTSRDFLLAAGARSLSAFKVSPNVPLRESAEAGPLAGASKVALGGRHGYYAVGNKIAKVTRRSPLLSMEAEGSGEIAIRKTGDRLFVYDPPGIPATEIVDDGVFNLNDTNIDTRKKLCDVLDATSRLRCDYDPADPQINAPSATLLDAYGVRLENDGSGVVKKRASLRTPEIPAILTMPGTVTELVYQHGRLFAGIAGAGAGLYVIDPERMTYAFHAVGDVFSMVVRDGVVYLGGNAQLMAYRWAERLALSTHSSLPGNVNDVRLGREGLYVLLDAQHFSVGGIAENGAIASMTSGIGPFPATLKAVVPFAEDLFVTVNTAGELLFWRWGAGTINLEQAFSQLGPVNFIDLVNGRLLIGIGNDLHIVEAAGGTPKNLLRRVLTVPGGDVMDAGVLGDVLAVAGGPAGAVAYQLK